MVGLYKNMNKKKKIIIVLASIIVILAAVFGVYRYLALSSYNRSMQEIRRQIEDAGFNNVSGIVKSVEGDSLVISAEIPENYSLLSSVTGYTQKEFLLKMASTSEIYSSEIGTGGELLTRLDSFSGTKPGDIVSVIVKENVLKNNELSVVELIIKK